MKLVDAHCHLDFECFDGDRDAVIQRAHDAGVQNIIIPGVKSLHWQRISQLCEQAQLHACYGIHPYFVAQHSTDDLNLLAQTLATHQNVALGECGLDYREGQPDKQLQITFFTAQLEIAQAQHKPVVIHSVRATEDVIRILKDYSKLTGMIHSYSGSFAQARQLIDMGFYISLGGSISYERASKLRKLAANMPLDSLLIETDAPDQPDVAHAEMRNEPAYLRNVLDGLAELRNDTTQSIAEQTSRNSKQLFQLD